MSDSSITPMTKTSHSASGGASGEVASGSDQASLVQRVGAFLIDVGVMVGISVLISVTVGMILPELGSLLSLLGLVYMLGRDSLPFLGGQSVGKKLLGLRAVTADGQSLSGNWRPGLMRNAVLLIPFFTLVELFVLYTKQDSPDGLLRLGDQWAGTRVLVKK